MAANAAPAARAADDDLVGDTSALYRADADPATCRLQRDRGSLRLWSARSSHQETDTAKIVSYSGRVRSSIGIHRRLRQQCAWQAATGAIDWLRAQSAKVPPHHERPRGPGTETAVGSDYCLRDAVSMRRISAWSSGSIGSSERGCMSCNTAGRWCHRDYCWHYFGLLHHPLRSAAQEPRRPHPCLTPRNQPEGIRRLMVSTVRRQDGNGMIYLSSH